MPARERRKLTDAAIARLRPRSREYTVWDNRVPSLGVRVRATGGKSYVLLVETDGRAKRVSLGPVSTRSIEEARAECHQRRANPEPRKPGRPPRTAPLFREFVEGPWKAAHFDGYKPTTRKTYVALLDARLLPAFGAKPLDRITAAHVRRWFDAFSGTAPGNANHARNPYLRLGVPRDWTVGLGFRPAERDLAIGPRIPEVGVLEGERPVEVERCGRAGGERPAPELPHLPT